MKKRLLTLLLTLSLLLGLCPVVVYGSNVVTPPPGTNYNTEANAPSKSSAFSKAHVQNLGATTGTNGTARQLQVVVQPKSFDTPTSVYAVVMRRTDYNRIMPNGPAAAGLSGGTYSNLDGTLGAGAIPYYGMARGMTVVNSTAAMTLDVVVASGANDAILSQGGSTANIRKSFTLPTASRNESTYFDEYVLIVFGGDKTGSLEIQPGEDKDANYYIDYFYMDANGYVLTPSYGVRYNTNDPYPYDKTNPGIKDQYSPAFQGTLPSGSLSATGVNVNGSSRNATVTWIQRARWNADLSEGPVPSYSLMPAGNSPSRTGYSFVGWSTEPIRPLKVGEDVTTVLPAGAKLYTAGEAYPKAGDPQPTLYQIHDLYAVWRTVPVQFGDTVGGIKGVEAEKENGHWVINYPDNRAPQFGVAFNTNAVNLAAPSSNTGNQPNGVKVYSTVTYKGGVKDATPTLYGLTVGRNGNSTSQWLISGTPNANSDDKPVKFEITVTDESNGTQDMIVVNFTKVKKGAQPVPTKDANTGLQSQIETVKNEESGTETKDGQIFGFYSKGPTIGDDTGYLGTSSNGANANVNSANGTVGTGTMTDYYIAKRMIYQYRPTKVVTVVDGEPTETEIPWDAYEDESNPDHAAAVAKMAELGYDKMPNGGWREVPMPKNWYGSSSMPQAQKDNLAASLQKNAKTVVTTDYAPTNGSYAPVSLVTSLPAGFDGWLDSYGYIEFSATEPQTHASPIVHGLTEDSVYEIRFRANANNEVSASQFITIGGVAASSGGGSSAGLLFNLMRGSVWQIPKPQEPEPPTEVDVTTINVTMGAGGTATITNVKEAETTADDGDETEPTEPVSVTINANETKTLTVLGQPVTVTVTPTDETHTVTVTADEAPLTPAEGVYTLPEKTVTGTLALNISLTAPETPPDTPAARAAVTTETDVTDTLFAASPTGTLPDGSALGLGEGETLQLRDPDNNPVDSITFYVSATGSVLSPGAIDIYTCTLNASKTGMVWTKNDAPVTTVDLNGTFLSLAAQFGGKPNPSDFRSITMLSWTRTEVLGTVIVPKATDATATVKEFVQRCSDTNLDEKGYSPDATKPFTNKRGYSFDMDKYGVWLNYDSTALTHYGSLVNGTMIEKPTGDDVADLTNVTENMTIVACYGANEYLSTAAGAAGYYSIETLNTERIQGNLFLIDLKVKREATVNEEPVGVQRLGTPALHVQYTYGSQVAHVRVDLTSEDEQTVQLVATNTTNGYSVRVIDAYGLAAWPAAADKSPSSRDTLGTITNDLISGGTWTGSGHTGSGYLYVGTLKYINKSVMPGGVTGNINMALLDEMKLNYTMVQLPPGMPNIPVLKAAQVPGLIQKAFNELNGITAETPTKEEYKELTYEQIQYAIAHNGALQ